MNHLHHHLTIKYFHVNERVMLILLPRESVSKFLSRGLISDDETIKKNIKSEVKYKKRSVMRTHHLCVFSLNLNFFEEASPA